MTARMMFCLTALIGWIALSHASASEPATLTERLSKVRYDIKLADSRFTGSAAPAITEALTSAHYVIIGKEHFTRKVPLFRAAVCDQMAARVSLRSHRHGTGLALPSIAHAVRALVWSRTRIAR